MGDEIFDWEEMLMGAAVDLDRATQIAAQEPPTVAAQLAFAQVQALMAIADHLGSIAECQEKLAHPPIALCRTCARPVDLSTSGDTEAGRPSLFGGPPR